MAADQHGDPRGGAHDHHEHDDDEPDTLACYRHPGRETALRCSDCERPICTDCSVAAAVGIKCPECGRLPRAARATVPTRKVATATIAAGATAVVLAWAWQVIDIPFLGFIVAWLVGMVVGEVARRASGGFRDPLLGRIAAGCAGLAFVGTVLVYVPLAGPSVLVGGPAIFTYLAGALAAWGAWNRAS